MAQARRIRMPIRRVERVHRIQLTLTEGEADFLQAVVATIGGSETHSPRKYAKRIAEALSSATGQHYSRTDAYRLIRHGAISFASYDKDPFLRERGKKRTQETQ